MCTGLAIVALVVMSLFDDPRQFRSFMATIPSSIEALIRERPRLLVEAQKGLANEPLPLGVAVEHASGGEIVMIQGLPEGVDLSLGRRSDGVGWSIPVADLEQTYVGVPANFVGAIETTATLRSASGKVLDRQALHYEWRAVVCALGLGTTSNAALHNLVVAVGGTADMREAPGRLKLRLMTHLCHKPLGGGGRDFAVQQPTGSPHRLGPGASFRRHSLAGRCASNSIRR